MMLIAIALILLLTETVSQELGIVLVAAAVVLEVVEIWFWLWYLKRHRVATGSESMIGERATVIAACRPEGTVRLRGEIWAARSERGAEPGEKVRVRAIDGLTLEIE